MVLVFSVRAPGDLWATTRFSVPRSWFSAPFCADHRLVATPLDAGLCPDTKGRDPRITRRRLFPLFTRLPRDSSQCSRHHNTAGMAGMEATVSSGPLVECSVSTGMERSDRQHCSDPVDHIGAWTKASHQPCLCVWKPLPLCCGRSQLGTLGTGYHDS